MKIYSLLLLVIVLTFTACEKREIKGPHKVHFDRDMCQQCRMVVSDRNYVTQIIDTQAHKAYNFDDIGCALLWMDETNQTWYEHEKIYVADNKTGKFIDAKKAYWSFGNTTPMDFGFAANVSQAEKSLTFSQMKAAIMKAKTSKMKAGVHAHE